LYSEIMIKPFRLIRAFILSKLKALIMGTELNRDVTPPSLAEFVEPKIIKICAICFQPLGHDSTFLDVQVNQVRRAAEVHMDCMIKKAGL
jgi:hypothetical protein